MENCTSLSQDKLIPRSMQLLVTKIHPKVIMSLPIVILLLSTFPTRGQNEQGYFDIKNYSHEEYKAHHQNWFITQDNNGFIYTGNGDGVLEFDGASWRLISSPGLQAVRTVVVDQNNTKWVGADRELGYLEPDSLGFLRFKSLKDKIPSSHSLTANVWQIFPEQDRILFFTDNMIYSWKDSQFYIIPHPGPIYREYQVNGEVYVKIAKQGMFIVDGDSLRLIPNGEQFKNIRVVAAIPYNHNSALFASKENGLFVYDGRTINKLESDVKDFFKENNLYAGQQLTDSTYAFATLRAGVVIINKDGNRIKEITTNEGALNNQVHGMVVDKRDALWLALQTGISQVEPHLPYQLFDKRSGLEGTVAAINRHKGTLYVGTYDGLYALKPEAGIHPAKFHRVAGIKSGCFSLLSLGENLLAATANGTFLISEKQVIQINNLSGSRVLYQSKRDPSRVYIGHMHGLSTIYFKNGQWEKETEINSIKEDIFSIAATNDGTLWLGSSLHQIIKIEYPEISHLSPALDVDRLTITRFDDGLPEGSTNVWLLDEELLVTTDALDGPLFRLDPGSGKFVPEANLGKKFGLDSLYVYPRAYQNDGQYILLESEPVDGKRIRFSAVMDDRGTYLVQRLYDERFRSTTENHMFWDSKDQLWIGGETITKYSFNTNFNFESSFNTHIRKVTVGQDSIIFGGHEPAAQRPIFNFLNAGLRFEFAATSLMAPKDTKYRYRLQGFDETWSDWTLETKKDYTNLPAGNYQFHAQAQNIYGQVSSTGSFNFEILAPWYGTTWAYIAYAILAALCVFCIVQWRSAQLKRDKRKLEKLVDEKIFEIKAQAEKLKEMDKVKSRFFANISHEFRTPLTLILGPLKDRINQKPTTDDGQETRVMYRNAQRLQRLINQLLDLSKIESHSLKLQVSHSNIHFFLRAILSSFSSHAQQRDIQYETLVPEQELIGYFDQDKLEKIIYNLVSNAFKFTPDGGEITVSTQWKSGIVRIEIMDNGCGIPADQIPYIFDRFYQTDDSQTRKHEGTGIGLALTKELVSLHKGAIKVKSDPKRGTTFTVTIPLEASAYQDQEILASPASATGPNQIQAETNIGSSESSNTMPEGTDARIVLVVEDNRDLRGYIKKHLPNYRVLEAPDGSKGLKIAIKYVPDLIISDVMMPKMDGIALLQALKTNEKTSHIPVILLTAKADLPSKLEGFETGADEYLTKPFDALELQTRCENLIEQRKLLRNKFSSTVILKPKDIAITSTDEIFLRKVMETIEKYLDDSSFSVETFQREVGMSRMQLHRKLKALTDFSATEFIRVQRLKRAAQLLTDSDAAISDICYRVGFNSLSYFTKCFKEQYGVTPSDYAFERQD